MVKLLRIGDFKLNNAVIPAIDDSIIYDEIKKTGFCLTSQNLYLEVY